MSTKMWTVLTVMLVLAANTSVESAPPPFPDTMSYQGVLRNAADGQPLDGRYQLTFRIYDRVILGIPLWTESQEVNVDEGVFSVTLGAAQSMTGLAFDRPYWIGITVGADPEMSPRTELTAVPYSRNTYSVRESSITSSKIAGGTVVRSLNGLTDAVTLTAGSNVTITPSGNDLTIDAASSAADSDWQVSGNDLISIPSGNVGVGDPTPDARLSVLGGNWNMSTTEGDLRIGTDTRRLKFGIDTEELSTFSGITYIDADGGRGEIRFLSNSDLVLRMAEETFEVWPSAGSATVKILGAGDSGATPNADLGGEIQLFRPNGTMTVEIDAEDLDDTESAGGKIAISNGAGVETITLFGQEGISSSEGGAIYLRDDQGQLKIRIDADYLGNGQGRVITEVLEITGGSDLSENFDVDAVSLEPGSVVSIDPDRPGGLELSRRAYDRRVAGVVSGAGGVRPGMLMGQSGSIADGTHPVALTGRVYVRAEASSGAIVPGDLLTTSSVPGHAMKVVDHGRANGAILGKAMSSLESGRGLVLVLVSLQ